MSTKTIHEICKRIAALNQEIADARRTVLGYRAQADFYGASPRELPQFGQLAEKWDKYCQSLVQDRDQLVIAEREEFKNLRKR